MNEAMTNVQQTQQNMQPMQQASRQFSRIGLMAFIGSVIIMVLQMVAGGIAGLIDESLVSDMNSYFLITMIPMYLIGMPLLILLLSRVPAQKLEKRKMKVGHWILSFFMCYALMYLSNLIGQFITMVIGAVKGSLVQDAIVEVATGLHPAVCFVFMVLFAPVLEELIFRKLLVDRMVKYGEGTAIVISAFMFGMYHGNLNQLVYAFAIGLFFAFIYVKTGKLIYTIVLHMVINFMGSVVGVFILDLMDLDAWMEIAAMTDPAEMMEAMMGVLPGLLILMLYMVFIFAIVITGIILLIVKHKRFTCKAGDVQIPKGKRFKTVMLNLGMILFSILWIGMIILQLFQ
ncbi:MAG: CPBP family intramembrane metalloprotease [Lachnospiraceae bacterium]|nr:CPBP family intramembrane metalloprotease [Lachnospiraceae bacterium]